MFRKLFFANLSLILLVQTQCQEQTTEDAVTHHPDCPWDADLTFHPAPGNCSMFYQCYGGQVQWFVCSDNLVFNPDEQVCDYPENVDCVDGTPTTSDPITPPVTTPEATDSDTTAQETTEPDTTAPDTTTEITEGPNVTTVSPPPPGSPECPPDADTSLHAMPDDCTRFYICYSGILFIFECDPGLHFNPIAQVCDFPEDAGCVTIATTSTTVNPPTQIPNDPDCPLDADPNILHPLAGDCESFYICYEGTQFIFHCFEGLLFNPAEQICDYAENVQCEDARRARVTKKSYALNLLTKFVHISQSQRVNKYSKYDKPK